MKNPNIRFWVIIVGIAIVSIIAFAIGHLRVESPTMNEIFESEPFEIFNKCDVVDCKG